MAKNRTSQVDKIIALESGELSARDTVRLFKDLVNSGLAYQLQGSYGRQAASLINSGFLVKTRRGSYKVDNARLEEALAG